MPGGIFNRGFIRSYAERVGLDPEQAVADYERLTFSLRRPEANPHDSRKCRTRTDIAPLPDRRGRAGSADRRSSTSSRGTPDRVRVAAAPPRCAVSSRSAPSRWRRATAPHQPPLRGSEPADGSASNRSGAAAPATPAWLNVDDSSRWKPGEADMDSRYRPTGTTDRRRARVLEPGTTRRVYCSRRRST